MNEDVNFCPYCDAPQHKVLAMSEKEYFCKSCNRFFSLAMKTHNCPKCAGTSIGLSDFPGPSGEPIFQCKKCKKMFKREEM